MLYCIQTSITQKFEALGMFSADGEFVEFSHPTLLEGPVEAWLCDIERMMRWTLKEVLKNCRLSLKKNLSKRDKWIKDWCGQVCGATLPRQTCPYISLSKSLWWHYIPFRYEFSSMRTTVPIKWYCINKFKCNKSRTEQFSHHSSDFECWWFA